MMPSSSLKAQVLSQVRAHPAPPRREATRRAVLIIGLAVIAALAIFVARGGIRPTHRAEELMLGTAGSSACIAVLALWAAFGRSRSMLGRPRATLVAVIVAAPLALLAFKILWSAGFAGGLEEWRSRAGFKCLGVGLSTGGLPLFALAFMRRSSNPTHATLAGTALGVAVGAWAATLVDLWCPVGYPPHLLIGHLGPMLMLGALGAVLGWRVMGIRAR